MSTTKDGDARQPAGRYCIIIGAVIGLLVAAVALGVGELLAGSLGVSSPVVVVGDAAVDLSPTQVTELAIALFGVYDKVVLLGGTIATLGVLAAVLGVVAPRHPTVGYAGLAAVALLGVLSAVARRTDEPLAVVPIIAGTVTGAAALYLLLRRATPVFARPAGSSDGRRPATDTDTDTTEPSEAEPPRPHRRRFLLTGTGVLAVAVTSGTVGRYLSTALGAAGTRSSLRLPSPAEPLPALPPGADLRIGGLARFTTPNRDFYRVDTALSVPRVAPERWSLRIHGMVDRPLELSFDDLLRRRIVESDITLTCVSNEIGGELVGNTRWLGVRLDELLRAARPRKGADQILSTSFDDWTCGTPVQAVLDGRDALLAIAMDGEPLPFEHGFPARMVVPGLYGFVSATKWVTDIELTRFADERAYWATRGWAVEAPIKTMSRIDVPAPLASLDAGRTTVAGVAWAQRRGIDVVELRLDGGDWKEAYLADVPGIDTWRQWSREVDLAPGRHTLEVRATDASGYTQTDRRVEPIPNGATGWHSVQVTAE